MNDIHDIKPALEMGADWGWAIWVLVVLAIVAAALLACWLWRRRRKQTEMPSAAPPISAEDEAMAALDHLASDDGKNGKQFYFHLSAVLRRYVERRYAIPAAEMTLEELLPKMDRLPLEPDLFERFKELCRHAEPIKFADAPAQMDQMPIDLAFGREFVSRTTETVPEADQAAPKD